MEVLETNQERVPLGYIPIMLKSYYCSLKDITTDKALTDLVSF